MLLSSAGHPDGPIPPETRRVAGLLAREKTGEILAHLHRRPYLAASEVARLEDIHVATAQRYLKELAEAGLVGSRPRQGSPRATEEYWILESRITIQIDLDGGVAGEGDGMADAARRIAVRDLGPNNVVYDTNPRTGNVEGILILSDQHPRLVEDRIRLSATVGRFLAHLPYTAGHAPSVWEIMQRAGLHEEHLPEVLGAIGRFTERGPGPLLATATGTAPGDVGPSSAAGSARPLDPEIEDLFRSLAAKTDRFVTTPAVAILEILPFDPSDSPRDDTADDGPDEAPDPQAEPRSKVAPEPRA